MCSVWQAAEILLLCSILKYKSNQFAFAPAKQQPELLMN